MNTKTLNYDVDTFYFNLISKELHKTNYYTNQSFNYSKLTFLNKLNRSHYWFPANTGSDRESTRILPPPGKVKKLKQKSLYSTFSFSSPIFLDLMKLHIKTLYGVDVESFIESPQFNNALVLLNETFRKQAFKKTLPKVRTSKFNTWHRSKLVNRNVYLSYFMDFSPHRTVSKFRKFSFISLNAWWFERTWLFAFENMGNRSLKFWRPERFKERFLRFAGMSYSFWAGEQLKYNYYNINSFDLVCDPYSSEAFIQKQPSVSSAELQNSLKFLNDKLFNSALLYWFIKNSGLQSNVSQLSYFAFSYATHHYSYGAKRLYLKNYYAQFTPKYAHAYYNRYRWDNFEMVFAKFRWYMHLVEPVYWNLIKGLAYHPHERWTWESVSWWEDNIYFFFHRFNKKRRKEYFLKKKMKNEVGYYNIDLVWLYKEWFHENIFLELISSYFKSYFNFQYLTPNSRFGSQNYPTKRLGHFDPKWQSRLYEYTYHGHPDYFFPSTKDFYDIYSDSAPENHLESFLMLNFSWKLNDEVLFFPHKKRMLRFRRSTKQLTDPHDSFAPSFKTPSFSNDFIFPLLLDDKYLLSKQLTTLESCLVFLLNFFYKSTIIIQLDDIVLNFLYSYLNNLGLCLVNRDVFLLRLKNFTGLTYADFFSFLIESFDLTDTDCVFHKERIVVEYTAFKRWYTLLISEYINNN